MGHVLGFLTHPLPRPPSPSLKTNRRRGGYFRTRLTSRPQGELWLNSGGRFVRPSDSLLGPQKKGDNRATARGTGLPVPPGRGSSSSDRTGRQTRPNRCNRITKSWEGRFCPSTLRQAQGRTLRSLEGFDSQKTPVCRQAGSLRTVSESR
jgi:hypothetical protein